MKKVGSLRLCLAVQVLTIVFLAAEGRPQDDRLQWADQLNIHTDHAAVKQDAKESAECTLCEYILSETVEKLGSSLLTPMIEVLYQNCGKYIDIPYLCTGLRKDLLKFMTDLLNALDQELCVDASFCQPTANTMEGEPRRTAESDWLLVPTTDNKNNSILCDACREIVEAMDSLVFKYLDQVVAVVSDFCHKLAPPTDKECVNVILDPLTAFIKGLEQEFGPTTVCTKDVPLCTDKQQ